MSVGSIDAEGMKKVWTTKVRIPTATRIATTSTTAHSTSHRRLRPARAPAGGGAVLPPAPSGSLGPSARGPRRSDSPTTGAGGVATNHVFTGAGPVSHRESSELEGGAVSGRSGVTKLRG